MTEKKPSEGELISDKERYKLLPHSGTSLTSFINKREKAVTQAQLQHDKEVNFPKWAKENGWVKTND